MSTEIYHKNHLSITRHGMGNGGVGYEIRIDDPFVSLSRNLTPIEARDFIGAEQSLTEMGD